MHWYFLLKKWEKLLHCKSFSHFFSKKYFYILDINVWNFTEMLTNDVVSFEQPGLGGQVERFRLRNAVVLLAFFVMMSMWWFQDKVLSVVTPRSPCLCVRRSSWSWIVYSDSTMFRLLDMRMTSHLSGLNFICQSFSHWCRLSMSSWRALASAEELISIYISTVDSRYLDFDYLE